MTPQQAHEFLPLVQAVADGKQIQILIAGRNGDEWVVIPDPNFCDLPERYRVKPAPRVAREFTVSVPLRDEGPRVAGEAHHKSTGYGAMWERVKVREILDETPSGI